MKKSILDKKPISYWSKEAITCPVCGTAFKRELMLSGSGRINAGELTDELHRNYIPSPKYGAIYPLIYDIAVCPKCLTALTFQDMTTLKDEKITGRLLQQKNARAEETKTIFGEIDFSKERTLPAGAASYYLVLQTYEFLDASFCPTMKRAIASLRAAWLCEELNKVAPHLNYDYVSKVFYQKALFFYNEAVYAETERTERSSELSNFGPDVDKNYGWDGVIYLQGLLEYKYGQTEDAQARLKSLAQAKVAIARMFGLGKSSKSKPGPLLEVARNLYDTLGRILKEDD